MYLSMCWRMGKGVDVRCSLLLVSCSSCVESTWVLNWRSWILLPTVITVMSML